MGARAYAPTIGRFLQVDPIPGGSANAYDYVDQSPLNGVDVAGLSNGCGSNGEGWNILRDVSQMNRFFHAQCNFHDNCYDDFLSGYYSRGWFNHCNDAFDHKMNTRCGLYSWYNPLGYVCSALAGSMYKAVQTPCSWDVYLDNQHNTCVKDLGSWCESWHAYGENKNACSTAVG